MLEIYVLDKNNKWQTLDLFNDESVEMVYKTTDLKELEKAYTPFTQDFAIPASSNNTLIFDFYFDTNTVHNKIQYYDCQLFVNGQKNRVGRIGVTAGKYENDTLITYSLSFYSGIKPLKELIGDDKLSDLDLDDLNINWNLTNVHNKINNVIDDDIMIPLISVNRFWNVGGGDANDLISNAITIGELRPAIKIKTLLQRITEKYNISINIPYSNSYFNKLFVWLNKSNDEVNQTQLIINKPMLRSFLMGNTDTFSKFPVLTATTNGVRLDEVNNPIITPNNFTFRVRNIRKVIDTSPYTDKVTITLNEVDINRNIITTSNFEGFTIGDGSHYFKFVFSNKGRIRYFEAYISADEQIYFDSFDWEMNSYNSQPIQNVSHWCQYHTRLNTPSNNIKVFDFKSALDVPTLDFLSSILKTFNLKILEDKNQIYKMEWLNKFHNEPIDITEYVDLAEKNVESQQRYKKIKISHNEEDYLRNESFRSLMGFEYGTEVYESESSDVSEEYEIETGFNILSYFNINNSNIVTSYGFDSEIKPVNPETLTIFFKNDRTATQIYNDNNVQQQLKIRDTSTTLNLNYYIPFQNTDGFDDVSTSLALTFNNEVFPIDNEVCESNLYSKFYDLDFRKIYANNTYINNFTAYLPAPILNEITMQNTLIIRDKKYSIYEMNIDVASGKSELKLIDFHKAFEDNSEFVYPPFFGASYDGTENNFRYAINQGQNISADIVIAQYVIEYTNTTTELYNLSLGEVFLFIELNDTSKILLVGAKYGATASYVTNSGGDIASGQNATVTFATVEDFPFLTLDSTAMTAYRGLIQE